MTVHFADKAMRLNGYTITACTQVTTRWTTDAAAVTCGNCLRTHAVIKA